MKTKRTKSIFKRTMMVKKHFLSFFFIATLAAGTLTTVQAQTVIGMGTEQPNPNAVLELVPEQGNQGFLAPRLTTAQRQAASFTGKLSRADYGLLVFDVNEGKFYYWFNGAWRPGTSGGTDSPTSEISGTTWYAGTTAPSNVDAAEGDFYINESTGEVFRFNGSAFTSMGSLSGTPASTPNLSTVLQRSGSAGNQTISDLASPTQTNDAATKGYVDTEIGKVVTPSLENVLLKSNSANFEQIVELGDPNAPGHAVNKKYVDDQVDATRAYVDQKITNVPGGSTPSLEQVLNSSPSANSAGDQKITGLKDPDDPQDAATKNYVDGYVDTRAKITDFSVSGGDLIITEGGNTITTNLPPSTPASLDEGHLFVGNASDDPIPVTISGHITINASGVATITDAVITTAKIANGAVTKEKINADVAGEGLEKNTTTDALDVKVGNGLAIDGGAIRLINPEAGYLGIGQGTTTDIGFREMTQDGALNAAGELTVKGLRGRTVANTTPDVGDVLRWNGTAWEPDADSGGGSIGSTTNGERQNGLLNTTQPTGSDRQVGTLWVDKGARSGRGALKMWNGNNWETIIRGGDLDD